MRPVLGESPQGHVHLSAMTLLSVYGTNGALNATGLQQAFAAIIACQVNCLVGHKMQLPIVVMLTIAEASALISAPGVLIVKLTKYMPCAAARPHMQAGRPR